MASADDFYIDILNKTVIYLYRFGNPVIYIMGTVGNLLSILIFTKKYWRKNVCVVYFLICLLLSLVYHNCTILATSFIIGWNINEQDSSVLLCKLLYYVSFVVSTTLPTVLILASVDRLLISSQNVDTRLYSSKRLAYFSVSIATIFWLVFNFHILVKTNIYEIYPSLFVCYYDLSESYVNFVNYSLTTFNCLFCLLMIILSMLSFKNVRRIRALPRPHRREIRSMTKKDFQLLRCLFAHVIVYISVSICSSVYSVYQSITRDQIRTSLEQAIVDFLDHFLTFIFFTFHCSSFFIFICVSKAFRHEFKRLIYKMFGKNLIVLRDEENRQETVENKNHELNTNIVSTIVIPS